MISKIDFLISENNFRISEIYTFSDIRNLFSDIRKSALKSYLEFHKSSYFVAKVNNITYFSSFPSAFSSCDTVLPVEQYTTHRTFSLKEIKNISPSQTPLTFWQPSSRNFRTSRSRDLIVENTEARADMTKCLRSCLTRMFSLLDSKTLLLPVHLVEEGNFGGPVNLCSIDCLWFEIQGIRTHYDDVIMSVIASQITSLAIVYSTVYSGPDQRKDQSSASLAFVRGSHRGPVNSPHKWPVSQKMFPFDDVIMKNIFDWVLNTASVRRPHHTMTVAIRSNSLIH